MHFRHIRHRLAASISDFPAGSSSRELKSHLEAVFKKIGEHNVKAKAEVNLAQVEFAKPLIHFDGKWEHGKVVPLFFNRKR